MSPPKPLTPERIQQVLEQLATGQISADPQVAYDFERLMEIYCVVKTGGVELQKEAAEDYMRREQARIEGEIAELKAQDPNAGALGALAQEIIDLNDAVDWRRAFLESISPAEEAAVVAAQESLETQLAQH